MVVVLGVLTGACVGPKPGNGTVTAAPAAKVTPVPPRTTSSTVAPSTTAPWAPTSTAPPATPTTTASPVAPPQSVGMAGGAGFSEPSLFWDSDADLARQLDGITATGARWLRIDVSWAMVEGTRGQFSWSAVDRVVNAARARGLSVLGELDFTPAWARPAGTTQMYPPTNPQDFVTFARAAVTHFGANIRTWEIWNEPNSPVFWQPGADPVAYVRLLNPTYDAIKALDPGATVLTGGTAPGATGGGWIAPLDFLTGIYNAGGGGHFDAVAHHPYNWPFMPMRPEPYNYNYNAFAGVTPRLHELMVARGDGNKKIWGTEMGAPVPTTRQGVTTTNAYLASYVDEAFTAWRQWSWTGPLMWYSYRDKGTDAADPEQVFGLVTRDYTPKAVAAFTNAI
jgi:hypothetical protein